ncbi:MAG: hypothetical protein ACE19K_00035 [Candidatus Karelsulcia muelleri]
MNVLNLIKKIVYQYNVNKNLYFINTKLGLSFFNQLSTFDSVKTKTDDEGEYTISFFFQNLKNNLTETIIEKTINKLKFIFIKKIKAIIR